MEVILTEDVDNLGKRGDVVSVAAGYGRNFLLPKRLAVAATVGNMRVLEQRRAAFARRESKEKGAAELLAKQLQDIALLFSRKSGESGVLYGSVTSQDIGKLLEEKSFHLDRRKIGLREPIKALGEHTVPLKLHREVVVQLSVVVVPDTLKDKSDVVSREEFEKLRAAIAAALAEAEQSSKGAAAVEEKPAGKKRARKSERAPAEEVAESDQKKTRR